MVSKRNLFKAILVKYLKSTNQGFIIILRCCVLPIDRGNCS